MPRKSTKRERQPWEADFMDVGLTDKDKAALPKWDADGSVLNQVLSDALFNGCKVSLSYQLNTDTFTCACTIPKQDDASFPVCLLSKGPDYHSALKAFAYKVVFKLDNDLLGLRTTPASEDKWG